jgi:hypothetical protein
VRWINFARIYCPIKALGRSETVSDADEGGVGVGLVVVVDGEESRGRGVI